ncbi:MAG: hypothetical protein ACOVS5_11485, partial [Oligoflexus sp.]
MKLVLVPSSFWIPMAAGLLVLASSQAALANSERMKRVAALLHLEEQKVGPEERRYHTVSEAIDRL